MKKFLIFVAGALALAACGKTAPAFIDDPDDPAYAGESARTVRIVPLMTKVTETSFENTDAIGVTVTPATEVEGFSANNLKFVYDGSAFSSSLKWYSTGTTTSTIMAYYPWSETVPTSFTVQSDQRNGTGTSDFVAGSKADVLPTAAAVPVPFKHKLTRIKLNVTNNAEGDLDHIVLKGGKLTALLDQDFNASADPDAEPGDIIAFEDQSGYYLILPPQTVSFVASVFTTGGDELTQAMVEATLEAGKQYTINMIVNPGDLSVVLSGEIEGWNDGGEIGGEDPVPSNVEEHLDLGYIIYHDVQYNVVKLKDNKWWMAQNLAYVPDGFTPASDLSAVTAGVFYPLKVNDGKTSAEFDTSADGIAAKGYLYQAEVALGLQVGDLTTVEAAQALEGTQGICPDGWHVPTLTDIQNLVGKVAGGSATIVTPYNPNAGDCLIQNLNADGFNMDAFGAISIQDNTKTTGTFMGWASGYPDKISSGMFCGSSYAGVTYNTSNDPTTGIKNLQFFGFMPMTNKTQENLYTCNGSKVSYRIAGPVRCVRNE